MWLKLNQKLGVVAVLSACFVIGCNKDDNSSGPIPPPSSTQPSLNGPRTALDLKFTPVTLQAPPSWIVQSYNQGSLVTVEGRTPGDSVSISLPVHRTISADQERLLEQRAKQDFEQHPDLLPKLGVRDITGGKVIEHLVLDQPTTEQAATQPIQTLQWTFTVCIPSAEGFTAYDLRFLGMTLNQYKTDQAFLRPIIDSLTYTPSGDSLPK